MQRTHQINWQPKRAPSPRIATADRSGAPVDRHLYVARGQGPPQLIGIGARALVSVRFDGLF